MVDLRNFCIIQVILNHFEL